MRRTFSAPSQAGLLEKPLDEQTWLEDKKEKLSWVDISAIPLSAFS